jgi:hypothetical protein
MPLQERLKFASTVVTVRLRRVAGTACDVAAAVARSSTVTHTQRAISAASTALGAAAQRGAGAVTKASLPVCRTCVELVQQNPELAEALIVFAEEVIPLRKGRTVARLAFAASRSVVKNASRRARDRERRDPPDDYSI